LTKPVEPIEVHDAISSTTEFYKKVSEVRQGTILLVSQYMNLEIISLLLFFSVGSFILLYTLWSSNDDKARHSEDNSKFSDETINHVNIISKERKSSHSGKREDIENKLIKSEIILRVENKKFSSLINDLTL
jgi:hypothetical protein